MSIWTDTDWPLVAQYLAGEGTPDERADMERWLNASSARRMAFDDLRAGWNAIVPRQPGVGTVHMPSMHTPALQPNTRHGIRTPFIPRGIGMVVAAIGLTVLVFIGFSRVRRVVPSSRPPVYATSTGQRANITLADGSHITLAPQSQLTANVMGSTRQVTLMGEAYFEVNSSSTKPFVVRTGSVTTRVLGTTFDVRHYASDRVVRIAVTAGKIIAMGTHARVTLTAGTVAHVTDSTALTLNPRDLTPYVGWMRGRLVFQETPVPALLDAVGRWYGYEFHMGSRDSIALAAERVTATFATGKTAETLALLKDVLNVSMTFDGTVVTLHARGSAASPIRTRTPDAFLHPLESGK